jgi:hypothetical protein
MRLKPYSQAVLFVSPSAVICEDFTSLFSQSIDAAHGLYFIENERQHLQNIWGHGDKHSCLDKQVDRRSSAPALQRNVLWTDERQRANVPSGQQTEQEQTCKTDVEFVFRSEYLNVLWAVRGEIFDSPGTQYSMLIL